MLCADPRRQLILVDRTYSVGLVGSPCPGGECQNLPARAPAGRLDGIFQTPFPWGRQPTAVGRWSEVVNLRASVDSDAISG